MLLILLDCFLNNVTSWKAIFPVLLEKENMKVAGPRLRICVEFVNPMLQNKTLFMATLRSRCGHSILRRLCFFFLFFFAYSQRSQIGCLPYFHTWCSLSANSERRSEMCCTRFAANTGRKNYAKNRKKSPSAHDRTTLSG